MSRSLIGPARALSPARSPLNAVFLTAPPSDAPWTTFPTLAAIVHPAATLNLMASLATSATGSVRVLFLPLVVLLGRAAVAARLPGAKDALRRAPGPRAVNSRNVPRLPPNLTTRGDRGCGPTRNPATPPRPLLLLRLPQLLRPLRPLPLVPS